MNWILPRSGRQQHLLAFRLDLLQALGLRHGARRLLTNARHRRALTNLRGQVANEIWREAGDELGAQVRELAPALLEFRLGARIARVRGQTTPLVNPVAEEVASDKTLAYRLLAEAGLPVPRHVSIGVGDASTSLEFLERVGGPLIVKPRRAGGGAGVTGEVRAPRQLRRALVAAGRYDDEVLVEQQHAGDTYRLLLLDGEVLDIIKRPRPQLVGDGQSTIEQLMFRQYEERVRGQGVIGLRPFFVDLDCLFTLEQSGYGLRSVIPAGVAVTVKTTTNYNGPDQSETVLPPYPQALVVPARRAAAVLDVRLAGVDLLSVDQGQSVLLEVNPVPALTHHYDVANPGRTSRVAIPILAKLLGENPVRADAAGDGLAVNED